MPSGDELATQRGSEGFPALAKRIGWVFMRGTKATSDQNPCHNPSTPQSELLHSFARSHFLAATDVVNQRNKNR
jgi:hypothetical protein